MELSRSTLGDVFFDVAIAGKSASFLSWFIAYLARRKEATDVTVIFLLQVLVTDKIEETGQRTDIRGVHMQIIEFAGVHYCLNSLEK